MADPFSIIAGSIGLADICIRFGGFLRQAKDGFQKVDKDLEELSQEIASLHSVSDLIKRSFESELVGARDLVDQQIIESLWQTTRTTLEGCQVNVAKLSTLITDILATDKPKYAKFKNLRKFLKQQSKEGEFIELKKRLRTYLIALQTSLAAVNVIYTRESQHTANSSFATISGKIENLGTALQSKILALQANIESSADKALNNAVRSAQNVLPLASLNRHFSIPQSVSSIFTGRATDLKKLKQCIEAPSATNQLRRQRRFVIYGLPGSGKTQFCCKFASDHKQSFWGIFWIDASSSEHAKQSFSRIARIGKVEPNERAVKYWLSSLSDEQPWLLVIDNADDLSFPVEELFPYGDSGVILITTRNPILKTHGTIGPRYFHFAELGEAESTELLLRAADEPLPWSSSTIEKAGRICTALGHLPLALQHAGKVVLARLCTLDTYLSHFEKNWARIRKMKNSLDLHTITDSNAAIYSSYELIHEALVVKKTQASKDALDLLKIFSFLHRQRIRVDIFLRAASNPALEVSEQQRRAQEDKEINIEAKASTTWAQTFRKVGIEFLAFLANLGYRPVLPRMFNNVPELGSFDEMRLREALKELFQFSLISANPDPTDDSYSMHPAVHLWVRERPEMTIGDQAIWCQAAATILTQAILLPPLGDKEYDETLRRDLLPHVSHVQSNERKIQMQFLENRKSRRRIWSIPQSRLNRPQAMQLVKFSLVYAQCGLLEDAEKLQLQVRNFCMCTLGMEHTATMDITLLLSRTYQLTKCDEAADLQQRVLDVCMKVRGKNDLKTLRVMDIVGSSRWQQGRVLEAREIHQSAVDGLRKVLGDKHVDTLRAMGNLGRAVGKSFQFTKAIQIHTEVICGLRGELGPSHLDTLTAMDNLAMAYFDRAAYGYGRRGDLDTADKMEQEVWEVRKEKLGKENLFTLWAGLNLARVKALRGEIDKALAIFLPGHEIARRNLGETHFGVLFGKMHYARILTYAKRYKEAEELLFEVIESHVGPRRGHPDRLIAIMSLIKCRNLLGKQSETTALLEELTQSTITLFGEHHPWVKYLLDPVNLSKEPDDDEVQAPVECITRIDSDIGCTQTVIPVAMIAKYGHIYA